MKNINYVYLLGAGFNQAVEDWEKLRPPLNNNFFNILLRNNKFNSAIYDKELNEVYDFISKTWKKSKKDLTNFPFNLEDFFTYLQLKINEKNSQELRLIFFKVKTILEELLNEFRYQSLRSEDLKKFGEKIYKERPNIITFNYDLILETIIEATSGVNPNIPESLYEHGDPFNLSEIPTELVKYSRHKWNSALSYGIKFDNVQLQQAGISKYEEGQKYYKNNELYEWKILKLHGSLNWFKLLPKAVLGTVNKELINSEQFKKIYFRNEVFSLFQLPELAGWLLDPIIITPLLYKSEFYAHMPFNILWKQAKLIMEKCNKLIIIGYSFSPADFNVRKLFLDSFLKTCPEELIIVNPDTSVIKIIKDLTHFHKGIVICQDLNEFLQIS